MRTILNWHLMGEKKAVAVERENFNNKFMVILLTCNWSDSNEKEKIWESFGVLLNFKLI